MDAATSYRQWESSTAHWSEPSMIGKESAAIWFWLNEQQRESGVAGNFLEVGTFRGHAASVMAAMAGPEVFTFLERHPHELCMFLCGFNKAYLARPKYLAQYRRSCGPSLITYLERCGLECTLCENAHSTELDYRSLVSRVGDVRYRGIGFMQRDFE